MALSKHLQAAVERAGLDASKYPDIASIRVAVRRSERLNHASSPEEVSAREASGGDAALRSSRDMPNPHKEAVQ